MENLEIDYTPTVMKLTIILISTILALCCSCSEPEPKTVNVCVDSEFIRSNKVLVDTNEYNEEFFCPNPLCCFKLTAGEHTMTVNGKSETFTVGEKGGILNVSHSNYVIIPVIYRANY